MASSLSPDVQPIASVGPDYLLKLWMQSLSPHFVDNQNKSVDLESEEFRTLLETVKKHCANHAFGSPTSAVIDDSGDWINDDHLFQDNLVASCYVTLRDLQNYAYIGREKGGRKVVFTGVPSLSGMSMTAKGDLSMGISSSCADPELAWSIIQEESAGFFAGQRTVDDVCKNIQKRATLVVQER